MTGEDWFCVALLIGITLWALFMFGGLVVIHFQELKEQEQTDETSSVGNCKHCGAPSNGIGNGELRRSAASSETHEQFATPSFEVEEATS